MGNRGQRYDIYAIVFMFSMAVFLEYQEAFSLIEDETLSYRQIIRTHYGDEQYTTPNEDVVVVYTDEAFYTEYGVFPLRRVDLSTIVTRLARMGAAVIGVDMLLDFNSAYGEDPTLEDAFQEAGNVVLVSQAEFSDNKFIRVNHAIDRFADFTRSGYSNISANSAISESIVRLRYYPEIQRHEGEWPFAVQVVADFLFKEPRQDENILRIGDDIAVQLDQFNDIYIDYPLLPNNGEGGTARLHQVVGLPASDVLFLLDEEELDELSFLVRGKIVLIGEVAEVAHDEFETPVGNVFGVEIIANTISTILRSGPLHAASFVTEMLIALLMMAIFLATRLIANPLPRNLLSVGLLGAYVVSATAMYVYAGLVLSMSYVLISSVVAIVMINARFYIEEMAQKAQIRTAFGQYLSPKVVAELEKNPEKLTLGGEERDMTAFFSDIAGFSTFSEQMGPTQLVNVLNDYLTEMCNIIIAAEGTVDKFEGDAIIAFWGAPTFQEDNAQRACIAAIDMRQALVGIGERFRKNGYPAVNVRMGLNSGPMVVGNMGSRQKLNYTIMGDTVNLASRLEGANKVYGSGTMISGATYERCGPFIDVRELDRIRVVGKTEAVTVYQLLGRKGTTTGLMADLVVQFAKAHKLYQARDYRAARAAFKLCTSIDPNDAPSQSYLKRCDDYVENPPPADWDGVYVLDSKG